MTAVYLAGPYAARTLLSGYAADLRTMGVDVTASWLDETITIGPGTIGAATDLTDEQVAGHAALDLADIGNADLLILVTAAVAGVDGTSGGRHVETGYAIAMGIPVIVVGQPENVFHRLGEPNGVAVVAGWHELVALLAHRESGYLEHAVPS